MQPPISVVDLYKASSCDMTLRLRVDRMEVAMGSRAYAMDYVPTLYIGEHQVRSVGFFPDRAMVNMVNA